MNKITGISIDLISKNMMIFMKNSTVVYFQYTGLVGKQFKIVDYKALCSYDFPSVVEDRQIVEFSSPELYIFY